MLPPTCLVVWMGDAQQTPGGIAKGQDQFAISRKQLMMRKRPVRQMLRHTHSARVCVSFFKKLISRQLPHWLKCWPPPTATKDPCGLTILTRTRVPRWTSWTPSARMEASLPKTYKSTRKTSNVLVGSACNPTTYTVYRSVRLFCSGSCLQIASAHTG